jgi:2-isopropylmalate synthase
MSQKIQKIADETGKEISTSEIWEIFHTNFVMPKPGHSFKNYSLKTSDSTDASDHIKAEIEIDGENYEISGSGNGPIDAFVNALNQKLSIDVKVSDYHQSAISSGSDAQAAAYIELQKGDKTSWGVGINPNTTKASFEAIIVGVAKLI